MLSAISAKLPHLAERLALRQPVNIVAIGGASTKGAAAGGPDLAYPHRLQMALAGHYPDVPIAVVNKGVPRQSTQQMVERFPTDVIAEDPILVVWEAGTSDAVRGVEIDDLAGALQAGLDEVKTVGIIDAPSRPCSARKAIMLSMFQARPQSIEAIVKPAAEAVNSQRVENTRVSQPESGIITISAMR